MIIFALWQNAVPELKPVTFTHIMSISFGLHQQIVLKLELYLTKFIQGVLLWVKMQK